MFQYVQIINFNHCVFNLAQGSHILSLGSKLLYGNTWAGISETLMYKSKNFSQDKRPEIGK